MSIAMGAHNSVADGSRGAAERLGSSFEELYERSYEPLVHLCRRQLGGDGDPEAIAQEAFIRAWASFPTFSGTTTFRAWLTVVARRLCIDHRRRVDRERSTLQADAAFAWRPSSPPDEIVESQEEQHYALRALEGLKPSDRRLIMLRDLMDWSYSDIARIEGVTVESVRGSLKRARVSLRRCYSRLVDDVPVVVVTAWHALRRRARRTAYVPNLRDAAFSLHRALSGSAAFDATTVAVAALFMATGATGAARPGSSDAVVVAPPVQAVAVAPQASAMSNDPIPKQRPAPSSPRTRATTVLPGAVVDLVTDQSGEPESFAFEHLAASPAYEDDGVLLATGYRLDDCSLSCHALLRSEDRGQSWHRLPAIGMTRGTLLLSPRYTHDQTIFMVSEEDLRGSFDGGTTFVPLAPVGGAAAMSPTFETDGTILLGRAPGWRYVHGAIPSLQPIGLGLPVAGPTVHPAFSPSFARDRTVFVGTSVLALTGQRQAAVTRCVDTRCMPPVVLDGSTDPPRLAVSPRLDRDGLVFAWTGKNVYRSRDGGKTFERVDTGLTSVDQSLSVDGEGSVVLATIDYANGTFVGDMAMSRDAGASWEPLGSAPSATRPAIKAVLALGDGTIVAARLGASGGGLQCSTDGGATWGPRCSRTTDT